MNYKTLKKNRVLKLKTNFLNSSPDESIPNLQTFHLHKYIFVNQVI